jgi:hypothetical protein
MKACTGQAVRQVVFTDVQVTIRQRAAVFPGLRALLLLAYTKQMLPLIGCSLNGHALERKACRELRHKINRITQAVGVILAFTGMKMFYFN